MTSKNLPPSGTGPSSGIPPHVVKAPSSQVTAPPRVLCVSGLSVVCGQVGLISSVAFLYSPERRTNLRARRPLSGDLGTSAPATDQPSYSEHPDLVRPVGPNGNVFFYTCNMLLVLGLLSSQHVTKVTGAHTSVLVFIIYTWVNVCTSLSLRWCCTFRITNWETPLQFCQQR